jgi:hypothetical protein
MQRGIQQEQLPVVSLLFFQQGLCPTLFCTLFCTSFSRCFLLRPLFHCLQHFSVLPPTTPHSPLIITLNPSSTPTPSHPDEALALGVAQGSRIIMSVPCCHKDLHRQFGKDRSKSGSGSSGAARRSRDLDGLLGGEAAGGGGGGFSLPGLLGGLQLEGRGLEGEFVEEDWTEDDDEDEGATQTGGSSGSGGGSSVRDVFSPLLRHGILRQRWLDLLTDSLRAQLLRVAGYR